MGDYIIQGLQLNEDGVLWLDGSFLADVLDLNETNWIVTVEEIAPDKNLKYKKSLWF